MIKIIKAQKSFLIGLFLILPLTLAQFTYNSFEVKNEKDNSRLLIAEVTGYTSSTDETDDSPFLTASQKQVQEGMIACPREYDFGTQIEIDDKNYVCEDRMALKNDGKFDIWFSNKELAFEWGRRVRVIKVLSPTETPKN